MDFRSFSQNREKATAAGANCKSEEEAKRTMEEKLKQYSGKSESELMSELMRTANKMKAEGKFDAAELENLYQRASGLLTSEQLKRLRSLIDMIK
ncbi:MAG: hypothetical protein GX891_03110 [Clostridiales bacterium]|nr:hypothetical protein [Clostridiales bacterium]